ncbi:amino acid ABC transporter permease [Streptomyces sp. NPDC004610]|uniref:amino acid ABC transporter permease n=1 Tax=unclassified Streptomyces TaxID=2593676 RepID=UPI0033A3ABB8
MDALRTLLSEYDVIAAFWMTIKLTFFGALGALLIGTAIAVLRVSPVRMLRLAGGTYVTLLRNTPLTLVVFFCAFGMLNTLGISLADPDSPTSIADNNFRWGVVALAVYHAAFVAEAIRSGVNTVPRGQAEAARAIGLRFVPTLTTIVLPQAFRGAITPLGNTLISLTKATTVLATIGVAEPALMMRNMLEFNVSLLYAIFFLVAAGYVILTMPMGMFFTWLSRRLAVRR